MKSLLLIGALVTLTALSTPAQTNQRSADAAQALRQYEWKLRTEVQRKGETKNVQVASVWFDSNGQKQTIVILKSPEPDLPKFGLRKAIAEKKVTEFRKTVRELGDLARSYAELSPEQLQRFMTTASVTPEPNPHTHSHSPTHTDPNCFSIRNSSSDPFSLALSKCHTNPLSNSLSDPSSYAHSNPVPNAFTLSQRHSYP